MAKPIRSHYPVKPSKKDSRDWSFTKIDKAVPALPSAMNLIHLCPPVYDQGNLGSCTGNAIAGAYEFEMMRQSLPTMTPSRLFVYYNERVIEGDIGQDSGAQIRDGIKSIGTNGVCDETTWPYDVTQFAIKPSTTAYSQALRHTALHYYSLDVNLQAMKQALAQGYPIVAGIQVYASFESQEVTDTGIVPMPAPNEACLGGHAILIVGYADHTPQKVGHLICRNSWGADWGDKGYFYLPYDYATTTLMSDLWVVSAVK